MTDLKMTAVEAAKKVMEERAGKASRTPEPIVEEYRPEVSEEPVVEEPVTLSAGQILYSALTGQEPTLGADFGVSVYSDEDWSEDDRQFIPALSTFSEYKVPYDTLESELRALELGMKVLVVGPTGSGKTTLQRYIAALINQPYLQINGNVNMDGETLLGRPWVTDKGMEFILGELPKAMRAGWMVNFDEPWKTPPGIQMVLQRFYERDGILQLDDMPGSLTDKQIVPKNTFKLTLCDNVVGTGDGVDKYGATMMQDGSTLNRIDVVLQLGYLSQADEVSMMQKKFPSIGKTIIIRMCQLSALLKDAYHKDEIGVAFSPRTLDAWAQLSIGMGVRNGFTMVMLARVADEMENQTMRELYKTVFSESL